MKKTSTHKSDVTLVPDGKTGDGKPMFRVEVVSAIPPEVKAKEGRKHFTPPLVRDDFGIMRPAIGMQTGFFGTLAELMRRR